jgi:hypothetical protein
MMGATSPGLSRRLPSDIMRAKWTHLLAVLAAVALASLYGQAQPASPIGAPLSDKESIVGTKEAPPFALKQRDGTRRGISDACPDKSAMKRRPGHASG